jgi:CspA family cold shock protein
VRFATEKLSRHPKSPLVAWHAKSVAASFLRPDQETGDAERHRQVVQPDKGLWVHQADGRRKDVFVHISAVERAGLSTLNENQVVEYDLVENRGKSSAENLKVS